MSEGTSALRLLGVPFGVDTPDFGVTTPLRLDPGVGVLRDGVECDGLGV